MVRWGRILKGDIREARRMQEVAQSLLPTHTEDRVSSPIPAKDVTITALRLKHQIEAVIPCELDEKKITQAHSHIITPAVVECAKSAGGERHRACIVFCLLIVKKWFRRQSLLELWDAELHDVRSTACEVIAKRIIEDEEDQRYLLEDVLLQRYSILVDGSETAPANVIEKASDLHALRVIGSSGYQKCIAYLWKGWLTQDDADPSRFVEYKDKANTSYWAHFDPDRMRVPLYQNALQIAFSIIYLALYTGAINTINPSGDLDIIEGLLYVFTAGFIFDEVNKLWKVGRFYLAFWNIFNSVLYALLLVSFITRMIALANPAGSDKRRHQNEVSYNFLAFSAPMFWLRLLLYFDTFRFFGTLLVVLKVMMRESLIFFALLFFVLIGFAQAFIGLDQVDSQVKSLNFVITSMLNAIMTSPDFSGFENYSPPFGIILYYFYTFLIMVILLNILIALYNSAYESVTDNATDEYMALFAQKTMQFVRAPDENVFIAPLNLVEIFGLILPFEWWLSKPRYERLNDIVMAVIYSPLLLVTAAWETRRARGVRSNKRRGADDDDTVEEWEQLEDQVDFAADGWTAKVDKSKPDIEDNPVRECRELRREVEVLQGMLGALLGQKGSGHGDDEAEASSNGADGDGNAAADGASGRYPTPAAE